MKQIRNFSIIAHIDHGKSTLADRMLEETKTVEARKMKDQVLDSMDLERERGITIKMQPVRMSYMRGQEEYELNLIDTPGHIDFSYEVSRALKAVEGVLLLVDSTQGIQAQTLTTLHMAQEAGLTIIPVLTKTDVPHARPKEVGEEMIGLLGCAQEDILLVSGKTGDGVPELLEAICERIPAPEQEASRDFRGLIFDFHYSNHRGVIVYFRVMEGKIAKGDALKFVVAGKTFQALEVGILAPEEEPVTELREGEIGYIVTGIKEPGVASVGDTLAHEKGAKESLAGYQESRPVVWASVFPESQDDFTMLHQALDRLKLSDSSLSYEEESSGILGRGFRCGFLGMLHLEIITERLRREFNIELIVTSPSIAYEITHEDGKVEEIYAAARFPDHGAKVSVREPWVLADIIVPPDYLGNVMTLLYGHEASPIDTEVFADGRTHLTVEMPLRELMRNFFDRLKNASSGYASLSYEIAELRPANVVRLDILVAEEIVPAFSRVLGMARVETDARAMVEKLYKILPRQMFVTKIQSKAMGRFIASKTLSAMKKDVTAKLYGGDITRKMKLREKQKKGKKKMLENRGKVNIPQDVFMKMVKTD
ncbi:MAG: translation elongation factor 4 [Candidatus Pacebacteria bacterium]|nr:translation elongation factor 4 [Candidatus Paceibacterota bacterium]